MQKKPSLSFKHMLRGRLILEDGSQYWGTSFGFRKSTAGEVVFNTGMVGYPETLTDPSYYGQLLTLTYPLIGNYGIAANKSENHLNFTFESSKVQIFGLIVSDYSDEFSHHSASKSLGNWLSQQKIPALSGIDTRSLTKKLREKGTMLGKILFGNDSVNLYDPNSINVMEHVSLKKPLLYGVGEHRLVLMDCGCKHNILHSLIQRGVEVLRVPWNYNFSNEDFDGLVVSNGPGNPKMCRRSIHLIRNTISKKIPIFGICLGNQLLALASGANTYKLKYGHRSQNQPVMELDTNRCLITSQNHGFAVDANTLPADWEPWFINLNDGTNEGIRHRSGLFKSVQFHPEASPGPVDADFLFDEFLTLAKNQNGIKR
jgi:carbamoyl-phosphate synthase small subunit